ncbi:MAG: N-acetylmuramoyl-L-alanine amidase [Rhodothermales bacterium]
MKLETPGIKNKRQAILRGVYEDNLRMTTNAQPPPIAGGRSRRSLWMARVAMTLAGVLVVLGGFQVYQEIQAKQRNTPAAIPGANGNAALTPAERMAQEFDTPLDPGLNRDVPIANLYGLQVKTIVIDPGHGGIDPGATGPTGLLEKDVTLDVARRLKRRLEQDHGFQILMARKDDRKMYLRERIAFANEHEADLFISIHVNAFPAERINSIETYYFSPQSDAQTSRLAAFENKDSDYSMAEWRDAIEKVGTTMKFQESKQLATSIQKTLYRNMRKVNSTVRDWGVKSGPFMVLLGVEVPAVLAEISVITNKAEEAKLYTPEHREQLAASLAAGVVDYLTPLPDTSEPTEGAIEHAGEKNDD